MRIRTPGTMLLWMLVGFVFLLAADCPGSESAGRDRTCEEFFELSFDQAYGLVAGRWVATGGAFFELEVEADPNTLTLCQPPPDPCVGNTNCMGIAWLPIVGRFRDVPDGAWTEAQGNIWMGNPGEKVWLSLETAEGHIVSGEIEVQNPSVMGLAVSSPSTTQPADYQMARQ